MIYNLLLVALTACKKPAKKHSNVLNDSTAIAVGAMKDVMRKC
jgi:hypothetical protein